MKKLVIVQPYIPKYRVKFFHLLFERLAESGIEGVVAAGTPEGQDLERQDSSSAPWHIPIKNRKIRIQRHTVTLGGSYGSWHQADAVIVGHLGSSLDTYRALVSSKTRNRHVGLWGHIKSYVNDPHPLDAALERWQLRHADQIFAYTPGGATFALEAGVVPQRVTTVMNSVDTGSLVHAVRSTTTISVENFIREHKIQPQNTLSYIGALDEGKRIPFLIEALDKLWVLNPKIRVLVAGNGSHSNLLEPACLRGQVVKLGYADSVMQALMARTTRAILMPGRIGLIAVEALILNLPILTTDWKYHSAEIEYLNEGSSLITSVDNPTAYAERITSFIADTPARGINSIEFSYPSIEAMVTNFSNGVVTMMSRTK